MKKILLISLFLIVGIGGVFYLSINSKGEEEILIDMSIADYHVYTDLDELQSNSDIIIEAKYTGNSELVPDPESGDPEAESYLSEVIVKKVYKGDLKKGDKIFVSEPGHPEEDSIESISGYKNMDKNGKYVLFLYKYDRLVGGKQTHVLKGLHQGKYDLNIKKKAKQFTGTIKRKELDQYEYFGERPDEFNKLKEQVVEEYGDSTTE